MSQCGCEFQIGEATYFCVRDDGHKGQHAFEVPEDALTPPERETVAMSDHPYEDNPGKTHFHQCWRTRGHHNCAVDQIELLTQELEAYKTELKYTRGEVEYLRGQLKTRGWKPDE